MDYISANGPVQTEVLVNRWRDMHCTIEKKEYDILYNAGLHIEGIASIKKNYESDLKKIYDHTVKLYFWYTHIPLWFSWVVSLKNPVPNVVYVDMIRTMDKKTQDRDSIYENHVINDFYNISVPKRHKTPLIFNKSNIILAHNNKGAWDFANRDRFFRALLGHVLGYNSYLRKKEGTNTKKILNSVNDKNEKRFPKHWLKMLPEEVWYMICDYIACSASNIVKEFTIEQNALSHYLQTGNILLRGHHLRCLLTVCCLSKNYNGLLNPKDASKPIILNNATREVINKYVEKVLPTTVNYSV